MVDREKGPQCHYCHGYGHYKFRCPKKVMVVLTPTYDRRPITVTGTIEGTSFDDLVVDSGADMTVIRSDAIPQQCYTGRKMEHEDLAGTPHDVTLP